MGFVANPVNEMILIVRHNGLFKYALGPFDYDVAVERGKDELIINHTVEMYPLSKD